MVQALDQLFEARRILGYSYVYAFYMFGGEMFAEEVTPEQNERNKNLFEDQQQMLEAEVCPCSWFLSGFCNFDVSYRPCAAKLEADLPGSNSSSCFCSQHIPNITEELAMASVP